MPDLQAAQSAPRTPAAIRRAEVERRILKVVAQHACGVSASQVLREAPGGDPHVRPAEYIRGLNRLLLRRWGKPPRLERFDECCSIFYRLTKEAADA